jgi:cytochrome c oxidase assembly protein subunit 19
MHYMQCLRSNSGCSTACRALSKDYLDCRMDKCVRIAVILLSYPDHAFRGLMQRDDWRNLGLADTDTKQPTPSAAEQKKSS